MTFLYTSKDAFDKMVRFLKIGGYYYTTCENPRIHQWMVKIY